MLLVVEGALRQLHVAQLFLVRQGIALLNEPVLASPVVLIFEDGVKVGVASVLHYFFIISIIGWGRDGRGSHRRQFIRVCIVGGGGDHADRLVGTCGYEGDIESIGALGAFIYRSGASRILLLIIFYVLEYFLRLFLLSIEVAILHLRRRLHYRLELEAYKLLVLGRVGAHLVRLAVVLVDQT